MEPNFGPGPTTVQQLVEYAEQHRRVHGDKSAYRTLLLAVVCSSGGKVLITGHGLAMALAPGLELVVVEGVLVEGQLAVSVQARPV